MDLAVADSRRMAWGQKKREEKEEKGGVHEMFMLIARWECQPARPGLAIFRFAAAEFPRQCACQELRAPICLSNAADNVAKKKHAT
jgi:hypothetical protein